VNGTELTQKKRSTRYLIRNPLQYRISGERAWHLGISTNISDSGILFEGDKALKPNVRLEVQLALPVKLKELRETSISVQAMVVRGPLGGAWAAQFLTRRLRHSPCRARIDSPDWGMGLICPGQGSDKRAAV
jgi:hypothetical protein